MKVHRSTRIRSHPDDGAGDDPLTERIVAEEHLARGGCEVGEGMKVHQALLHFLVQNRWEVLLELGIL